VQGLPPPTTPERYKHHHFPAEIISHSVWLYYHRLAWGKQWLCQKLGILAMRYTVYIVKSLWSFLGTARFVSVT
jgi:hypothetical protein